MNMLSFSTTRGHIGRKRGQEADRRRTGGAGSVNWKQMGTEGDGGGQRGRAGGGSWSEGSRTVPDWG